MSYRDIIIPLWIGSLLGSVLTGASFLLALIGITPFRILFWAGYLFFQPGHSRMAMFLWLVTSIMANAVVFASLTLAASVVISRAHDGGESGFPALRKGRNE